MDSPQHDAAYERQCGVSEKYGKRECCGKESRGNNGNYTLSVIEKPEEKCGKCISNHRRGVQKRQGCCADESIPLHVHHYQGTVDEAECEKAYSADAEDKAFPAPSFFAAKEGSVFFAGFFIAFSCAAPGNDEGHGFRHSFFLLLFIFFIFLHNLLHYGKTASASVPAFETDFSYHMQNTGFPCSDSVCPEGM